MAGTNIPDVLVVGCGGGGAVVAKECADAGLGVVVLEAGAWLDPQRDFAGLEWEMAGGIDSVFRWGPADRTTPPWPRIRDGLAHVAGLAGVGGSTLVGAANSPRAYPAAVELEWPISYGELIPYYEKVEATLPVIVPDILAPKDERFVAGCSAIGLPHLSGPDVMAAGWRIQPNAIAPIAQEGDLSSGCIQCGECVIGCRHPVRAGGTAKRGTHVTYAAAAAATDRCEIRTGCFATRILMDEAGGTRRVRGIRYRDTAGRFYEQDAHVVVLAGGAIESPRLWMASGLPAMPAVGRGLRTQWFEYVAGVVDREIGPDIGQTSMARADFPGYGSVSSWGSGPMAMALSAYSGGPPRSSLPPFASRGRLTGSIFKRRMEAYRHTMMLVCSVDDDASAESGVTLSRDVADEHNPAPVVRYRAAGSTEARRDRLARTAGEILLAAGAFPDSIHRADAPPAAVHQMGTMRMGRDASDSVVDDAGEAHLVDELFIADASVLPNALGGASPALTIQALATRTADLLADRHFGSLDRDRRNMRP